MNNERSRSPLVTLKRNHLPIPLQQPRHHLLFCQVEGEAAALTLWLWKPIYDIIPHIPL